MTMDRDRVPPTGNATPDQQNPEEDARDYDRFLVMPQDDDPAGEGHMFTPGPDWPPVRADTVASEGEAADADLERAKPTKPLGEHD